MEEKSYQMIDRRIAVYLGLVLGFVFICGVLSAVLPGETGDAVYRFNAAVFTAVPVLGAVLTRWITKDKTSLHVDLRVWKNWKMWLFSAFLPGIAIFLGMILFYVIFPSDLDRSGAYLVEHYGSYGVPADLSFTTGSLLRAGAVTVVISAVFIPLQLLELGEEIGWRGYLLPLLCQRMLVKRAVLMNGLLWGIAHAPLIYFGFNYGLDYAGAPWTGILMMLVVCFVIGIWTSYVMIRTQNCMYSAVIHGVVNLIGETGVFVSAATKSTLLGPNPSGILSMSVLLGGAVILFVRLKDESFSRTAGR